MDTSMKEFHGKLAVITGAGSGIGRAIAGYCAREGMQLALADVHPDRLDSVAKELEPAHILTHALDVSDADAFHNFAHRCCSEFGAPHLLFNNAGILKLGPVWSHSYQEWEHFLSVNVMGVVNGLNAFVPAMLDAGKAAHIINTGSIGSLIVAPGMAQYGASKMAVRGITESLAYDLAELKAPISVSLVCPGPVLTSMSDDFLSGETSDGLHDPAAHLMAGEPGFIPPEECAARIFDGIREKRFWIFTHPFNQFLKGKLDAIVRGENPVYEEVTFDKDFTAPVDPGTAHGNLR